MRLRLQVADDEEGCKRADEGGCGRHRIKRLLRHQLETPPRAKALRDSGAPRRALLYFKSRLGALMTNQRPVPCINLRPRQAHLVVLILRVDRRQMAATTVNPGVGRDKAGPERSDKAGQIITLCCFVMDIGTVLCHRFVQRTATEDHLSAKVYKACSETI